MNTLREELLKKQEEVDLELFEKIRTNPKPDPLDLWALSPERFVEWRKLNDFPILLNHFDTTLLLFQEWKAVHNLTNDILIANGELTPFLENKKLSKDKTLYLTRQTNDSKTRTFVAYKKIEGEKKDFGTTFNFEVIQPFTSYLDWLNLRGKKQEILKINSRHAPESDYEKVFIHADVYAAKSDFELLKMGGINIPVNGFGILFRGKNLEFVNLCGLKLKGTIYFGDLGNLSCSYCACDNWEAEDFSMASLRLEHCSLSNFTLKNSKIQQWTFYDTEVSGDFFNVKLSFINIYGGSFRPILQDCSLLDVSIKTDKTIEDNNYYAYKPLIGFWPSLTVTSPQRPSKLLRISVGSRYR